MVEDGPAARAVDPPAGTEPAAQESPSDAIGTSRRRDDQDEDEAFLARLTQRLAELPGVVAVALGGSRAAGNPTAGSDWDLAVYYRDGFGVEHVRALDLPGEVSEIGGWGGGVFNGGAWLEVEGRRVDVHYRDLDEVLEHWARARRGAFAIEPLLFHAAGIPTYLVVAELALNRVLAGELPRPEYPPALRSSAPAIWWGRGSLLLGYARSGLAPYGRVLPCLGLLAEVAACAAHAVAAVTGSWVTNDKRLLESSGLADLNDLVAQRLTAADGSADLVGLCSTFEDRLRARLTEVGIDG